MDSFKGTTGFCYNPAQEAMREAEESEEAFSGLLDIYIHHARNIHNICIYANQDVYAKFSLTCSPDEVISTRIVAGGGKNPQFDEHLKIMVTQPDAVLKCEVWMLSRAKNYLEDQLLGFTLVPLSSVAAGKGKLTQNYNLSSTDLFHSPAGTVKLTLSLDTSLHVDPSEKAFAESNLSSSISSEVVILDPVDYGSIEFPDINIAKENQQMVSEYFDMAAHGSSRATRIVEPVAPFLHLGASPHSMEDYDMIISFNEESHGVSDSPDGSVQNSGPFSTSTTSSLSDDRTSADCMVKKVQITSNSSTDASKTHETSPDTPTSKGSVIIEHGREPKLLSKEEAKGVAKEQTASNTGQIGYVFTSPLGNIDVDAEQAAMQQQIVDMYMKSMQQFTESLSKMKLPMDLGNPRSHEGDVIQSQNSKLDQKRKKDGSRVFYGSRAFF